MNSWIVLFIILVTCTAGIFIVTAIGFLFIKFIEKMEGWLDE